MKKDLKQKPQAVHKLPIHAWKILDSLITSYEKSLHAKPFQPDSNRRVMYSMKKYKVYDVQDFGILEEVNEQLQELQRLGYVTLEYDKAHKNHIVRVILCLDKITDIYETYYGRMEKNQEILQLEACLHKAYTTLHTSWMKDFIMEEAGNVRAKNKAKILKGCSLYKVKAVLQVLSYVEQENLGYLRQMSVRLFQDSKYFENELQKLFLSIVHHYEPCYVENSRQDYDMSDREVFAHLGFSLYPELFAFCGDVRLCFKDGRIMDTSLFPKGFVLQGDMVEDIQAIEPKQCERILLVENKTNYYERIQHRSSEELVIFAQGHFSPKRKAFYSLFTPLAVKAALWSDIDLGGFTMFARLKKEVFPQLTPYQMDVETYRRYLPFAYTRTSSYLKKVEKALDKEELACFHEVMREIIKEGKTLEQEAIGK